MRKHGKRLSLHKETLSRLESVTAGVEVGLAPTLELDCRPNPLQPAATRAVCYESLRFTDCPDGCTQIITRDCIP